eukprot:jgi/Chrzof1/7556/Cz02g28090.t1
MGCMCAWVASLFEAFQRVEVLSLLRCSSQSPHGGPSGSAWDGCCLCFTWQCLLVCCLLLCTIRGAVWGGKSRTD